MFRDRLEAAERLARQLSPLRGHAPLVLAIPRGAVPMGRHIADALEGELDVVLVRKIGAPGSPEFAIGAVSDNGSVALDDAARHFPQASVTREVEKQQTLLDERRRRYTPVRAPLDPRGREVVVVDDGSATGATMAAALTLLGTRGPQRLTAALGAASPDALARLEPLADEVVCLTSPSDFRGVGQFYADFAQVEDEEVIALLKGDRNAR
ncbi:phosphoribosyltransferase family protein [Halomonas piscis]|uniref:Phosphoribosyltransferase family protein n=1 Tax=Halomonas piscis TaxID=3031727 RepID=A0ABY9Z2A6_9GAMM|nr:phosphoribosyltransferase family protein [Halomonas piscis]WNK21172.1 phosphoribosyltransferase family protein [Halomonas piscis]